MDVADDGFTSLPRTQGLVGPWQQQLQAAHGLLPSSAVTLRTGERGSSLGLAAVSLHGLPSSSDITPLSNPLCTLLCGFWFKPALGMQRWSHPALPFHVKKTKQNKQTKQNRFILAFRLENQAILQASWTSHFDAFRDSSYNFITNFKINKVNVPKSQTALWRVPQIAIFLSVAALPSVATKYCG